MTSEAKKIRIFEPTHLLIEEKRIAIKLGKLHKFNEFTPRYKFYFLRQFMIGVAIISCLMNASRFDLIYLIIKHLNSREFISLASCCDDRLMSEFWYSRSSIFKKVVESFERKELHNHFFASSAESLERIKTGQELLQTYKLLQGPKTNWKIDNSKMLPNHSIACVAFNLKFPLLGMLMANKIYIIAYGGKARETKGQILFATQARPKNENFFAINWSPSGEYLLALQCDVVVRFSLFFYDSFCMSIKEICPDHYFEAALAINTKYLWMDNNSFIFATNEKYKVAVITMFATKKEYNFRMIDLTPSIERVFCTTGKKGRQFRMVISNFFVMPNPESNYLFLLSSCGKDHQHHRILYINKITQKLEKWVNLPGEVLEIAVGNLEFYVLIQERPEESFDHNSPSLTSITSELAKDFLECPFYDPWRAKTTDQKKNKKIIKCTETETKIFTNPCCSDQLTDILSTISPDSNRKYETLKEVHSQISKTNKLYVTKDFVYYTNNITSVTHVFGTNHHFYQKILNHDEFVHPDKNNMAWFHPTKSVFIQKKSLFFFNIYLHQSASQEEKEEFPLMKCFNYKSQVVFSSSSSPSS